MSIFITIALNSFIWCNAYLFHLVLFLGFVLSFGRYSSVSSFCLSPSVWFYVLGRSATSPSLVRVVLCRRSLVGPSGRIPLRHQSQVLQGCPLCESNVPSCCSWAMIAAGMPMNGVYPQVNWLFPIIWGLILLVQFPSGQPSWL